MKRSLSVLLAAVFLSLLTGAALAQDTKVMVRCLDQSGQPVRGAEVTLQDLKSGAADTKKSNKKGIVEFKKVSNGYYRTYARIEGYAPAFHEVMTLRGEGDEAVDLALSPGDMTQKMYFEDPASSERASVLMGEAAKLFQDGKTDEAIAKVEEVLSIVPGNPIATVNLGQFYFAKGQWEKAEVKLEESIKLLDLHTAMGMADYASVSGQVRQLIDGIPLAKLDLEASVLMKAGDYEGAITKYKEGVAADPSSGDLVYNLALAQARGDQLDDAAQTIDKALELRPDERPYLRLKEQIGQLQARGESMLANELLEGIEKAYAAEKYDDALGQIDTAFERLPDTYDGRLSILRARSLASLDRTDEAIQAYSDGIAKTEDESQFKQEYADYLFAEDRVPMAIEAYGAFFEATSQPVDSGYYDLAQGFASKGKGELAARLYEKILAINPSFNEVYYELGMYYFYDKEDRVKAKEFLTKYVENGEDEAHKNNASAVLAVMEKTK